MIKILFRDRFMVFCVKPEGILSQDSENAPNLPDVLREQLGTSYVGTVHRLDREASGVMVYSLDPKITGKLTAAFADKENTVKEYRALLTGVPEDRCGELHDLLYHDAKRNKTYVVDRMRKGVREASLYYEVVSVNDGRALVSVRLVTGRTHQIRVHMAYIGHPLCGDTLYGEESELIGRQALHCSRLEFTHPTTGERIILSAPLKGDMERLCRRIGADIAGAV